MNLVRPFLYKPTRAAVAGALALGVVGAVVLPRIAAIATAGVTTISINDVTKAEGTSAGTTAFTFTVSLNAASTTPVTVHYKTVDGTAKAGADYTAVEGDLTFNAATDLNKQVTVLVAADSFAEPDESFTVVLSNPTEASLADSSGAGTITNDDTTTAVPSLSLGGPTPVTEGNTGSTPATFTVSVSPTVNQAITVDYATASGSATSGTDFTPTSGTLTIPANASSATIPVPVLGDTVDEDNESFTLSLTNPNNATLSATSTATATITDDDASVVVSIADTSVVEGNTNARPTANFQVTLSGVSSRPVSVDFTTAASSSTPNATVNGDYIPASGTVTIPAGSTSAVIPVTIIGDTVIEPNEFFDVVISNPTNATLGAANTGTATIQDDESEPLITISSPNVIEGNAGTTNATVSFSMSAPSGSPVSVDYATATGGANGTATAGADFTAASGTVTFAPGETTKQVNIAIAGDLADEADETFRVVGSNVQGSARLANPGHGTVTISDDDTAPTLSVNDVTQLEGNGSGVTPFVFTVSLSKPSGQVVTVNAQTTNPIQPSDPTAPAIPVASDVDDYSAVNTTVSFPVGITTQTVTVNVNKDSLDEANEVFNVLLSGPTGGAALADDRGAGTITNDDAGPAVTITADTPSVSEGNSATTPKTVMFTVSLAQASTKQVKVNYATVDGSATSTSAGGSFADYSAASGTLTFNAGVTSQKVTVSISGDTFAEPDETFSVQLSNPVNATIGTPSSATQLITNDDAGAIPSVSVSNSPDTTEGGSAVFTFTAQGTIQQTVTVNYTTVDGPATGSANPAVEPGDYTKTTGSVTFTVAQPGPKMVSVPTINDNADEDDEFFHLDITSVQNGTQSNTTGSAKIIDNDDPPTITIADVAVTEGTSTSPTASTASVTLSAASSRTVTVAYATGGGTATATTDYATTSGTLTFAPGEITKTINLSVVADSIDEIDETFNITLSTPSNATIVDNTGVVTITDDDAAPTVSFGAAPSIAEGNAGDTNKLSFPVNLSATSGKTVTVNVKTSNGTATAGSDYTATDVTVSFAPGETSKNADVPVTGDTVDEANETVNATLSAPTNASLGTPSARTGTISNDDAPRPVLTVNNASGSEGGVAEFTVSQTTTSATDVTVKVTTADGTATSGQDYTPLTNLVVTIPAGQTSKKFTVDLIDDTTDNEAAETFTVTLSEPSSNADLGTSKTGTGTILADAAANPAKITTGPGAGGGPHIRTFNTDGTASSFFDGAETSGKRMARGDLDGDGVDEIITAGGFDSNGFVSVYTAGGSLLASVLPYGNNFRGGLFVAAGDVNGDGFDEVITAAGPGGGPHVRTFSYSKAPNSPATLLGSNGFYAFDVTFGGGVTLGAADLNGDGTDEILTGMASQGSLLRSFSYSGAGTATKGVEIAPYGGFTGGVFPAAGDLDGNGTAEIVTATGPGGGGDPHLRTFTSTGAAIGNGVYAYNVGFRGGFSVAAGDLDGDGKAEIVTGAGPGGGPHVKVYNGNLAQQREFFAYGAAFFGGVWVAAGVS